MRDPTLDKIVHPFRGVLIRSYVIISWEMLWVGPGEGDHVKVPEEASASEKEAHDILRRKLVVYFNVAWPRRTGAVRLYTPSM
jgi:hypothetical protein